MGLYFRKTFKIGPFRYTIGSRSRSFSVGAGPFRETFSSTGRRTKTLRLGRGWSWRKATRRGR
jgi:hypothetical protein